MDIEEQADVWSDPGADIDENGVDLNRLRRNLARSPEERAERNYRAAIVILECRRAAESAGLRRPNKRP